MSKWFKSMGWKQQDGKIDYQEIIIDVIIISIVITSIVLVDGVMS